MQADSGRRFYTYEDAISNARNDAVADGGGYVYVWNDTHDRIEQAEFVDGNGDMRPLTEAESERMAELEREGAP